MTPRLDISPSLIQFLSPTGNAFRTAGSALVDLGTQKVAQAEKEAEKNKLEAKLEATAQYNKQLNPEASQQFFKLYGADMNDPYSSPEKYAQANRGIGMISFDKPDKPKDPVFKDVSVNGKNFIHQYDQKTGTFTNTGLQTAEKRDDNAYAKRYIGAYTDVNGNRVGIQGDGTQTIFGQVKDYNTPSEKAKIVSLDSLPIEQRSYVLNENLWTRNKDGIPVVNTMSLKGYTPPKNSGVDLGDFGED